MLPQWLLLGVTTILAIIGWFIKKEIISFGKRLDQHQTILFDIIQTLSDVVGRTEIIEKILTGEGRRKTDKIKFNLKSD